MMRPIALTRHSTLLCALVLGCSACSTVAPPQPWEKGHLARADMALEGDRLEAKFVEHIYASREAASGGSGVGGGGCGCN